MNVMIVYGGKSCEHDISVITACLAKGYFKQNLYSVYIDKTNRAYLVGNDWTPRSHLYKKLTTSVCFLSGEGAIALVKGKRILKKVPIDVAVNCCHGVNGEDGCIAAMCQMAGIALVGSDIASSAVAMDKILTKHMLRALDMPVLPGVAVGASDIDDLDAHISQLQYPVIVKPARLGSSIGVCKCNNSAELSAAVCAALKYDVKALCEQALTDFTELNCAAMRVAGTVRVSKVDVPVTVHDILTFADKYQSVDAFLPKPPQISAELTANVQTLTRNIYENMGFGGVIRVDYLVDNTTGKLYVNEINTTPGSLAYGLWEGEFSRTQYGEALTDQAIADYREIQQRVFVYESGVLNGSGGVKKK